MKIDLTKVLLGSDFELFIKDPNGLFISAIPFIDGTKEEPQLVSEHGHAIQADGVLFEANVPPVSLDQSEQMWEDIQFVIEQGQERLPNDLKITCCPTGEFDEIQLSDPKARIFGCDPDFSAWANGGVNKKPDAKTNNRCCGLHFHVSFPGATVRNVMRLIRIMDAQLALPFLFLDEDRQRRKLYGKAGCFRFKDYGTAGGVEYRTLSNAVIKSKENFLFAFEGIKKSLKLFNEGVDYLEHGDRIQEAINEYNLGIAEILCDEFKVEIPSALLELSKT